MRKRVFALVLAICLAMGSAPETAFAKTADTSHSENESGILPEEQQEEEAVIQKETKKSREKDMETDPINQQKEEKEQKSEKEGQQQKAPEGEAPIEDSEKVQEEDGRQNGNTGEKINSIAGYKDVPLELPVLEEEGITAYKASAVPARYDGRTGISAVRDQNPYSTCWSFAALASGEASLIRQGLDTSLDLSEFQMSYFFYNHVDDPLKNTAGDKTIGMRYGIDVTGEASGGNEKAYLDIGGNNFFSTWAMAAWKAGGAENKSPYTSIGAANGRLADSLAYEDLAHLQNAYWLPFYTRNEYQQQNLNRVKKMIMEYGAVASSYYHLDSYYNKTYHTYYSDLAGTNHAISIVGWDDNFSRERFQTGYRPENDGAWLVRNSWGTGWGDSGYFWMSYEEKSMSNSAFVFLFEDADNYDYNYQYDGSCGYKWLASGSSEISVANRFEVYGDKVQVLRAVSIGMYSSNTDYSLQIYKDPETGNPISGIPMLSAPRMGTVSYTGYHTIPLEEPVVLEPGHSFSVVFTLPNGGSVFVDKTYRNSDWIRFVSDTEENQSFTIQNEKIVDLATVTEGGSCARIKAFSDDYKGVYSTQTTKADANNKKNGKISYLLDEKEYRSETIYAPAKAELSAEVLNYTGKNLKPVVKAVYDTQGNKIAASHYTVSYSSSKNPGSYRADITFQGDYYTGKLKKTYKIVLGAVSGFQNAAQSTSAIKLSWKQQKYAEGYALYASKAKNGTYKRIAVIKKNKTDSYTYTRLEPAKNYYFKIRAYQTIGGKNYYSGYSSILSSGTKPGKVTGLKAGFQSSSQIKLSWKKVSGTSGYQVYRYSVSKKKYEKVTEVSGTSYTDKKLRAGCKYRYKVRAYRKNGNFTAAGEFNGELSAITKPVKVTGLEVSAQSSSQIKLSWKKVNGASGYQVYRYDKLKKKYVKAADLDSSKSFYTDKKLKSATEFQYKVRAYKRSGGIILIGTSSNVLTAATGPAKISQVRASSVGKNSLKLSWKKVRGASGYQVYRYNKSRKKYEKIAEITSASIVSCTDKSLKRNTQYQYKVRAYKKTGTTLLKGSFSELISIKTKQ